MLFGCISTGIFITLNVNYWMQIYGSTVSEYLSRNISHFFTSGQKTYLPTQVIMIMYYLLKRVLNISFKNFKGAISPMNYNFKSCATEEGTFFPIKTGQLINVEEYLHIVSRRPWHHSKWLKMDSLSLWHSDPMTVTYTI